MSHDNPTPPPPTGGKKPPPPPQAIGCAVVVGIALVLGIWTAIAALQPPKPPDPKISAILACEAKIKDRLYSPKSADFTDDATQDANTKAWIVAGFVDAQNKLGVVLRADFQCSVVINNGRSATVVDSFMEH